MDNKRLMTTMLIVGVVMLLYFAFMAPRPPAPATAPATASAPATTRSTTQAGIAPATAPVVGAPVASQSVTLGSADPKDKETMKLKLVVSNVTAGIDVVQLNAGQYTETVHDNTPFTLLKADPAAPKPFATLGCTVNGQYTDLSNWVWPIKSQTETQVQFAIGLSNAEGKVIGELTKTIQIEKGTYNITVRHDVRNFGDQPMQVSIEQLGPTDLTYEMLNADPRVYQAAGLNSAKKYIEAQRKYLAHVEFAKQTKQSLGTFRGTDHLVWVATSNRFFTIIVRPSGGAGVPGANEPVTDGTIFTPDFAGEATAEVLGSRLIGGSEVWRVVGLRLSGSTVTIPAGGSTAMPLSIFMGPKQRDLLAGDLGAPPGSDPHMFRLYDYRGVIKIGQGMCAFCTFDWLAWFILWILDLTHRFITFGNYGWAIIVLVIVVRLLLHPLTRYSQVNMTTMQKKMAALQPEIERVKKKYAKDKSQQQQELMKVYKEHNVNPAGGIMGCLPMLIQMPIWLALYSGLQVDIDLRHATFIPGWINDLSNPDTVKLFPTPFHIPILGLAQDGKGFFALNLLPILLTIVFIVQMRVQMRTMPKAADEQQAQTQKISQYMILIFPLFLYNSPSGLNLYIFASTLGGLFDTWLVRRHMRAKGLLTETVTK